MEEKPERHKDTETSNLGVLYVATGKRRYLAMCACSVQSLRWAGYDGEVRVLVDDAEAAKKVLSSLEVEIVEVKIPDSGKMTSNTMTSHSMMSRHIKTRLFEYSNWDKTLYLDCDIIVLREPSAVWNEAGDADVAMMDGVYTVADCIHGTRHERDVTLREGVTGLQWNMGVVVWRKNTSVQALFEEWHREWLRFKDIDQLALLRALSKSDVKVKALPPIYNHFYGDSVLQVMHEGAVFWHVLAGRDVAMFRATFGSLFDHHCRVLQVPKRELKQRYYALSPSKVLGVHLPRIARQKLRQTKGRIAARIKRR